MGVVVAVSVVALADGATMVVAVVAGEVAIGVGWAVAVLAVARVTVGAAAGASPLVIVGAAVAVATAPIGVAVRRVMAGTDGAVAVGGAEWSVGDAGGGIAGAGAMVGVRDTTEGRPGPLVGLVGAPL